MVPRGYAGTKPESPGILKKNVHEKAYTNQSLSTLQSRPSHSQMPNQNPEYRESGGPAKPATERQTDPASPAGSRDLQ